MKVLLNQQEDDRQGWIQIGGWQALTRVLGLGAVNQWRVDAIWIIACCGFSSRGDKRTKVEQLMERRPQRDYI